MLAISSVGATNSGIFINIWVCEVGRMSGLIRTLEEAKCIDSYYPRYFR